MLVQKLNSKLTVDELKEMDDDVRLQWSLKQWSLAKKKKGSIMMNPSRYSLVLMETKEDLLMIGTYETSVKLKSTNLIFETVILRYIK